MRSLRIFSLTLCVAVLAGCGSGGSSGPSKASYVSQADAICSRGDVQIQSVPKPQLTGSSAQILKNLGSYVDQVLPLAQNVITRLKALKQPSSDHALLQRYFASLDDAVAKLHTLSTAARAGDAKGVQAGANALSSTQPDTLARQYGFKRCGGTGGTGTPAR
jgi:hypothetical protein